VVGKGEALPLVLNTVFHVGQDAGTVPEDLWRGLEEDPRVARAVPLAFGDAFRGFRIVGTSERVFGMEARHGAAVRVEEGAPFGPFDPGAPDWQAVIGPTVAAAAGLRVGDTFHAEHGLDERAEGDEHEEAPWRVVGVLARTGTAFDRAVLIPLEAFWAMEGHDAAAGKGTEGGEPAARQVSAVAVRVASPAFVVPLFQEIRASDRAVAARPLLEVRRLFEWVGNADRLLFAVSVLVVVVAAVGILVSMVNSMNERRRDAALMRALGARRRVVAGLVVGEAAATGAAGAVLGLVLGHALVAAGASSIAEWTGVPLAPALVGPADVLVLAGTVALCALAGLAPAVSAYRSDVASGLG
jgi:putative ABC transport system permease protein